MIIKLCVTSIFTIKNEFLITSVANALITFFKKVGTRCKRAAEKRQRCKDNLWNAPIDLVLAFGEYLLTIENFL